MRVEGDTEVCFGAGLCAQTAPEVFSQVEKDGIVVVRNTDPPPDQHELVRQVVQICPSGAISIVE